MRTGPARTGVVALVLLVLAACSLVVPTAAAPVSLAHTARPVANATVSTVTTSVPTGHAKKGIQLGSFVWALPAVAVLAAAVAAPLVLRQRRERADGKRTDDGS